MLRSKRSRRAQGPKDSDYDHEVNLVDHDDSAVATAGTGAIDGAAAGQREDGPSPSPRPRSTDTTLPDIVREDTTTKLLGSPNRQSPELGGSLEGPSRARSEEQGTREEGLGIQGSTEQARSQGPSIEVQAPTPLDRATSGPNVTTPARQRPAPTRNQDTAFDVLYENERGGFLCGIALFSPRALGNLDPSAWTNKYHRKSRTDTRTAQVPDPSWQWAWPEWRVNRAEHVDDAGWEYSFAFAKQFSWHRPKWWNSFVRRRLWVRKRERVEFEQRSGDPHMMRTDYFTVRPASHGRSIRSLGRAASRRSSRSRQGTKSPSQASSVVVQPPPSQLAMTADTEVDEETVITDVDTLMAVLRTSRIDREKIEAVENYMDHAQDLDQLGEHMHEIMSMFVYQISRRHLLTWLMQAHDDIVDAEGGSEGNGITANGKPCENGNGNGVGKEGNGIGKGKGNADADPEIQRLRRRAEAISNAVRHADEEVKKLAYWSDVKHMAEEGHSAGAVEQRRGWTDDQWEGVDKSGPVEPGGGGASIKAAAIV